MASNLSISLKLDLTDFNRQLEEVKQALQDAIKGKTVNIEADGSDAISEIDGVSQAVEEIDDRVVMFDGHGSGAIDEAGEVERAVEEIPEEIATSYVFEGLEVGLGRIARLGIALHTLIVAHRMLYGFMANLTRASNIQEDAETSLRAALRATGLEVEKNFEKLKGYASGIQSVTRYGDEAIISGTALMQNIGRLSEDMLPAAQKAAVGLAATYRIDLNTAFMLLGRAAKGQTQTLSRYGIVVDATASKEEQFQQVIRQGVDGFKIAEEEALSGAGALEQFKNSFGDLQEKVGDVIKVAIVPLVQFLGQFVDILNNNRKVLNASIGAVVALGTAFVALQIKTLALAKAKAILLAFTNRLILALSVTAAGVAVLGITLAGNKLRTDAASESQGRYNDQLQRTSGLLNVQKTGYEGIQEAERRLAELREEKEAKIKEAERAILYIYRDQEEYQEEAFIKAKDRIKSRYEYEIDVLEGFIADERDILQQEALEKARVARYNAREEFNVWREEKEKANRTELERVEVEYERMLSIARNAYGEDSVAYKKAKQELNSWREEEEKKINDRLVLEEKRALEESRSAILSRYRDEIELLTHKNSLGIDVYDQLTAKQSEYAEWAKKEYGVDSLEYIRALSEKEQAADRFFESLKQKWQDNNQLAVSFIDAIGSGFNTLWSSIIDTSMTGSERLKAVWSSLSQSFYNAIGQMITEWIKNKLTELAVTEAVEKSKQAAAMQTAAVEQTANAATQTSLLATIAIKIKSAFASITEAVAAGFKWLVSTLGPFGLAAGIGLGAGIIAAFKSLLSGIGFAGGGHTGYGDKYDPAGVVHKNEVVFESEITKYNLPDLLGLRALLQRGHRLKDIISNSIAFPNVSLRPLRQASYAAGGLVGSSAYDFARMENVLLSMDLRLKNIERKDTVVNIRTETDHIKFKREMDKANAEYNKRFI